MKLVAMPILHDVLKPVMDELISANRSCEIDPSRLEKGEELEANRTVLTAYIEWTANRIFGAFIGIMWFILSYPFIFRICQQVAAGLASGVCQSPA